jgi:hypothetical protein
LHERHGIKLSVETVRQAMLHAGLWRVRGGAGARTYAMRERRARRGELIQIDGSPHDWLEGRAARCCLLVFFDDATSDLMALRLFDTETTVGYMSLREEHICTHGLTAALYSDRNSIFRINRADNKDAGDAQTQFACALEQYGYRPGEHTRTCRVRAHEAHLLPQSPCFTHPTGTLPLC